MKNLDLFEDFTTLRWVRWNERRPNFNGNIYVRYNGKNLGEAVVKNKFLTSLHGDITETKIDNGKFIAIYSYEQIAILEHLYWLEEIVHVQSFENYLNSIDEEADSLVK